MTNPNFGEFYEGIRMLRHWCGDHRQAQLNLHTDYYVGDYVWVTVVEEPPLSIADELKLNNWTRREIPKLTWEFMIRPVEHEDDNCVLCKTLHM